MAKRVNPASVERCVKSVKAISRGSNTVDPWAVCMSRYEKSQNPGTKAYEKGYAKGLALGRVVKYYGDDVLTEIGHKYAVHADNYDESLADYVRGLRHGIEENESRRRNKMPYAYSKSRNPEGDETTFTDAPSTPEALASLLDATADVLRATDLGTSESGLSDGSLFNETTPDVGVEENPSASHLRLALKSKISAVEKAMKTIQRHGTSAQLAEAQAVKERLTRRLYSNPAKSISEMSAAEINKAIDKVDAANSKLIHQFIDAGRGNERPSEYLRMTDPLSMKARELYEKRNDLMREVHRRAGPNMRRLPKGFGPMKNPEPSANALYQTFHGRPSGELVNVEYLEHEHEHLTSLGDLCQLKVITRTNKQAEINAAPGNPPNPDSLPKNERILLCSDESGTSLYFVGGDQSLDLSSLGFNSKDEKDLMVIGVLYECTYQTEKGFHNFELTDYFHRLGEETGVEPILLYDPLSKLMKVAGGQYRIEARGIIN